VRRGIVASISGSTVWRWLNQDAIRPWCYRSWIFPRDPLFEQKAGAVLDLYHGTWEGKPLGEADYVLCTDEKTSIQARRRLMPTAGPRPGRAGRVEHEYERMGALAYWAAWDVQRAKLFGLCEPTTGIEPFHRLVDLVMAQEPYRTARRVFWVADNGSSHRGEASIRRLCQWHSNAILVHTPIHASWLNQAEIYFSVLQRKVLSPNDIEDLDQLAARLYDFQRHYESVARPFEWKLTRNDLSRLLARLAEPQKPPSIAA
jgi:DDE superfamily endonuclease